MNETKKISILIPVYNYEKYLSKCIESVINQTYKNIEAILIDDGSTDNSPNICDEYAQKDGRIVVVHKENGGIGSAYKIGVPKCSGDYIVLVDSDDWLELNTCECLVKIAEQENADVVMYSAKYYGLNGELRSISSLPDIIITGNDNILYDYFCISKRTNMICLFKKHLMENLEMLNYSIGIDEIINIQIMHRCTKLVKCSTPFYNVLGEPAKESVSSRAIAGDGLLTQINMHNDIIKYMMKIQSAYIGDYYIRYLNFLINRYCLFKNKKILISLSRKDRVGYTRKIRKEFIEILLKLKTGIKWKKTGSLLKARFYAFKLFPDLFLLLFPISKLIR